jgi:hypothetical protein
MGFRQAPPSPRFSTGELYHECLPRHRHQEFLRFLRTLKRQTDSNMDIHFILDDYATHKHPKVLAKAAREAPAGIFPFSADVLVLA